MGGIKLELADPDGYLSPKDYVEQHLAPVAQELHRLTEELMAPGSTSAEDWSVDMVPEQSGSSIWMRMDRILRLSGKAVFFDGSTYFTLPKDLLRAKQVKVQFVLQGYAHSESTPPQDVEFRLVDVNGHVITGSSIKTASAEPAVFIRTLPFGDELGCIASKPMLYFVEGRACGRSSTPVCRRLALSFVYI